MTPIRPRHALCAHCGYYFNAAVPVVNDALLCPECGRLTPLSFEAMSRRRRRIHTWAWTFGLVPTGVAMLALLIAGFELLGHRAGRTGRSLVLLGAFAAALGLSGLLVLLRRGLVRRRTRA
jgi:hypothetical protein